jgi:hypothetical protein
MIAVFVVALDTEKLEIGDFSGTRVSLARTTLALNFYLNCRHDDC